MKPDKKQLKFLQDYLQRKLTYRETFEEIYDHILSAIEQLPQQIQFEVAVNKILQTDFGGYDNLGKVEMASKKALVKESFKKFTVLFTAYFKFPYVLYTGGFFVLVYYLASHVKLEPMLLEGIFALSIVFPGIVTLIRLYYTGYTFLSTKKSARDRLFNNLGGIPVRIFVLINLFIFGTPLGWIATGAIGISILLTLALVYNFAFYKLYKAEFKMSITT
ncbi:hypothetical protein [Mucilaginibacter segetis]|uniref:Uncharacterized protein n=1 Tax=Mucilaginibacter segetis TaxID=2793071 RepID=A0A934ULB1_9SPHI|nr:hypothetical protein [Mucilaginibacter segetis]MBK0378144.1 hypothetical protein [Mucilaginibacter segetis]